MQIIPAIDIQNGKCVRLTKGDFTKQTIYSDDPLAQALAFESQGAKMIHVVDLDGAKTGIMKNKDVIKNIAKRLSIPIEVGGGIRTLEDAKLLYSLYVNFMIIGTTVLEDKDVFRKMLNQFDKYITVSLDARDGKLVVKGWQEQTENDVLQTAKALVKLGVKRFMYTDVERDGMLTKPNFASIKKLRNAISETLIVGGGISSIAHIKKLKQIGVDGVIIGKALYEGKIDLKEALNVS